MTPVTLPLRAAPPFDFVQAATSHGWVALAPNDWAAAEHTLRRVERLESGRVIAMAVRGIGSAPAQTVEVEISSREDLSAAEVDAAYAAATLLMFIGRYDEIGCDTIFRDHVSRRYLGGERPSDREMLAVYDTWGAWRHLAYWYDLTPADKEAG